MFHLLEDKRMEDVFEVLPFRVSTEDDVPELVPAELSLGIEKVFSKLLDDGLEGRLSRRHKLPGDDIGIDHGDAHAGKELANGGFP
jgi:hypothetical protein